MIRITVRNKMHFRQCAQNGHSLKSLTTKMRFENVTPRIVKGVNSGGRVLLRGKVSCKE